MVNNGNDDTYLILRLHNGFRNDLPICLLAILSLGEHCLSLCGLTGKASLLLGIVLDIEKVLFDLSVKRFAEGVGNAVFDHSQRIDRRGNALVQLLCKRVRILSGKTARLEESYRLTQLLDGFFLVFSDLFERITHRDLFVSDECLHKVLCEVLISHFIRLGSGYL